MIVYPKEEGVIVEKDNVTAALFEWAEFLGVKINPKLRYPVRFPPGYLGIQTIEKLSPGESILSCPNQSMLSTKYMNHPSLERIYTANPNLYSIPDKAHEDNRMLTFFLWEVSKGSSSPWYPYFEFLPKDLETLIDWTDAELEQLQDPDLVYNAKAKRQKEFDNYTAIRTALSAFPDLFCEEDIEINRIHWCWKLICTRSYSGKIPYATMIPIADLFNHNNVNTNFFYGTETEESPDADDLQLQVSLVDDDDPINDPERILQLSSLKLYRLSLGQTNRMNEAQLKVNKKIRDEAQGMDQKVFLQSKGYVEMTSATKGIDSGDVGEAANHMFRVTCSKFESFEAGAQVYIMYGKYSNRQLLMHYGFAMKDNIYNYARIKLKLAYFLSQKQVEGLGKGYSLDFAIPIKLLSCEICLELLRAFRCFIWDINVNTAESFFSSCDLQLELSALERMLGLLNELTVKFPTTIEQDEEILSQCHYKDYFAVIYRLGVKNVIKRNIGFTMAAIGVVNRLLAGQNNVLEKFEFETDAGKRHSDFELNRKAIKCYMTNLQKYFQVIVS